MPPTPEITVKIRVDDSELRAVLALLDGRAEPQGESPHECKYKEALKEYSDSTNWLGLTWQGPMAGGSRPLAGGTRPWHIADEALGEEAVD